MSWYSSIFHKDEAYEKLKNNKSKIPKNIYENGITMQQHVKKFHIIHYVFKYKFLVPLIKLGNIILGKNLITKIPKEHHNRNILVIDRAFDEAVRKWHIYYLRNGGDPATRKSKQYWLKRAKNEQILNSIKKYLVTMYMYDTAYREFVNILAHEVTKGMIAEYNETKKTGHLFFTTDMYDVNYFVLEKALRYNVELSIQEGEKLLQDYHLYHPKGERKIK